MQLFATHTLALQRGLYLHFRIAKINVSLRHPVAVPEKIFGLMHFLDFFDRGHSLPSLHLPRAALGSLPVASNSPPDCCIGLLESSPVKKHQSRLGLAFFGTPERTLTSDLSLRRRSLYTTELLEHILCILYPKNNVLSTKNGHIFHPRAHIISGVASLRSAQSQGMQVKRSEAVVEKGGTVLDFSSLMYEEDSGAPSQR